MRTPAFRRNDLACATEPVQLPHLHHWDPALLGLGITGTRHHREQGGRTSMNRRSSIVSLVVAGLLAAAFVIASSAVRAADADVGSSRTTETRQPSN
jgi:hypothetical protein